MDFGKRPPFKSLITKRPVPKIKRYWHLEIYPLDTGRNGDNGENNVCLQFSLVDGVTCYLWSEGNRKLLIENLFESKSDFLQIILDSKAQNDEGDEAVIGMAIWWLFVATKPMMITKKMSIRGLVNAVKCCEQWANKHSRSRSRSRSQNLFINMKGHVQHWEEWRFSSIKSWIRRH